MHILHLTARPTRLSSTISTPSFPSATGSTPSAAPSSASGPPTYFVSISCRVIYAEVMELIAAMRQKFGASSEMVRQLGVSHHGHCFSVVYATVVAALFLPGNPLRQTTAPPPRPREPSSIQKPSDEPSEGVFCGCVPSDCPFSRNINPMAKRASFSISRIRHIPPLNQSCRRCPRLSSCCRLLGSL